MDDPPIISSVPYQTRDSFLKDMAHFNHLLKYEEIFSPAGEKAKLILDAAWNSAKRSLVFSLN